MNKTKDHMAALLGIAQPKKGSTVGTLQTEILYPAYVLLLLPYL